MQRITAAILTAATLAAAPAAFAGSKTAENVNACAQLVRAELPNTTDAVDVQFKRVKGTSRLQKLTLKVAAEDVRGTVTCKVRRGEAPTIEWDDTLEAFRTELAARKVSAPTAN